MLASRAESFPDRQVATSSRYRGSGQGLRGGLRHSWFFGFLRVVEENVQNPHDIKVDCG